MGSDESHFNVSVGSDGQSHKTVSANHNLSELRERRAEAVSNRGPSAYQPTALPLGQTGSLEMGEEGDYIPIATLPPPEWSLLQEGADRVAGQLCGDKECPFSGVTESGRVWRKVPESEALSMIRDGDRGGRGRKSEGSTAETARKRPERPWKRATRRDTL